MGSASSASYYSLAPARGWRLLMLDAYDVSLLGWPPGHPHHAQAAAILDQRNPNEVGRDEAARSQERARMRLCGTGAAEAHVRGGLAS